MIRVVGTSHVSEQSIKRIESEFEEFDPDIVCLELDRGRFNALMSGEKRKPENLTHRLLERLQRYIGKRTGVMPGEEMKYAYQKASENSENVYLIDRDIRITLNRLKQVRRKEKAKALLFLPFSFVGSSFDLSEIPSEEEIERLKQEFKKGFPEIYRVLLEERDEYMSQAVQKVAEDHPGDKILVVVGAAHEKGIRRRLDEVYSKSSMEEER